MAAVTGGRARTCAALAMAVMAPSALPTVAHGQPASRRVRFEYERGAEAEHCPEAPIVRELVSARLGYDPFDPTSDFEVRVRVEAGALALSGRIETRRGDQEPGVRLVDGPLSDCRELTEAIVLAVSIAIDPTALARPPGEAPVVAPTPEPVPSPAGRPGSATQPEAAPPTREEAPGEVSVGIALGLVGSVGAAPEASFGFQLGAELRWEHFSIGLGGRADLPASARIRGGRVEGSILVGEVAVCGWLVPVYGCGVGFGGAFRGAGLGLADSQQVTRPHGAVGGRIGAELALYGPLSARFSLDVIAALTRTSLLVGDERVWTMPPVSGSLSALLALHFS